MCYKLDKQKTASFDVDAQNTFTNLCPDELPVNDGENIVYELNQNALFAKIRVGSKDAHSSDAIWIADEQNPQLSPVKNEKNVDLHWNAHAIIGTFGFQLIEELPPVDKYDYFVWKGIEKNLHPYGACYHDLQNKMSTGVIEYLKLNNIENVIVGGLAFEFCVKTTILQLVNAGFKVYVNLASTRALTDENFESTVHEFSKNENIILVNNAKEFK